MSQGDSDENGAGTDDWGSSTGIPQIQTVAIDYGTGAIAGQGDARALSNIVIKLALYRLVGNISLSAFALLMLALAAFVAVFAPDGRETIIRWIIVPSSVLAFGAGGFAAFQMRFSWRGLELGAGKADGANSPPTTAQPGFVRRLLGRS